MSRPARGLAPGGGDDDCDRGGWRPPRLCSMFMPRFLRMVGALLIAVVAALALLWVLQRSLLYLPTGALLTPAQAGVPAAEAFSVATPDGLSLGAWFLRARLPQPCATVIVFNGNAGNRSHRGPLAARLAEAGFGVCVFDYRGYGGNGGSPTEAGLIMDGRAVYAAVARRADVDPARLILLGESLGTGVAMAIARDVGPLAIVLRSPFTSIADAAAHHYWFLPVRALLWDRYDSLSRVGALTCPAAIVAGDADRVVPFALSQRLFDAVRSPKRLITVRGADHNDFPLAAGDAVVEAVRWAADAGDGTSK